MFTLASEYLLSVASKTHSLTKAPLSTTLICVFSPSCKYWNLRCLGFGLYTAIYILILQDANVHAFKSLVVVATFYSSPRIRDYSNLDYQEFKLPEEEGGGGEKETSPYFIF